MLREPKLQVRRMRLPMLVRVDPIKFYPYTNNPLVRRVIEDELGIYKPALQARGVEMRGGELILVEPPEGVVSGDSVPVENDMLELEEQNLKAVERRIKSLERQDRLKKEVEKRRW